jgi:hypothetical protein
MARSFRWHSWLRRAMQRREAHMTAAAIIQSVAAERDDASVERHAFAMMRRF